MSLCQHAAHPAHCRCLGDGAALCPSYVQSTCSNPDFGQYTSAGETGAACEGYPRPNDPLVHGTFECNYCRETWTGEIYEYKGHNGEPCVGYAQATGKRVPGKLAGCF